MQTPLKIVQNSILQFPLLLNEVTRITNGEPFIFATVFGEPIVRKSEICQFFSGIKHELGDGISVKTRGAFMAYCGRINELIFRHRLHINIEDHIKMYHVFCFDTEC